MTRWSPRSFTGSRVRRIRLAFLTAALLAVVPPAAHSQALQIQSLQFPTTSVVGPWVTYRVRTQSRALTPREYTQRVAIVGRERYHDKDGFWVELKTEGLPSGRRIERGFFVIVGAAGEGRQGEDQPDSVPSAPRPTVVRDGMVLMVDDDRMPLMPGEEPVLRSIRFRTLGCYPLTGAIESTAVTLPEIIEEMLVAKISERQGRVIDYDEAGSMEQKKREGYF